MSEDPYIIAKRKVKAKKGFYRHLSTYVIINAFLIALNIITQYGHSHIVWWSIYPILGWGVSLAIHYTTVFGVPFTQSMNEDWEEREIEREVAKMKGKKTSAPPLEPDEELELKEFKKLRKDWDDQEFV